MSLTRMTLHLYSKPNDPSLKPLMGTLRRLALTYTHLDIEANSDAHSNLLKLTGAQITPTLVFEDGTYLIQPTPKQFAEKMLALAPKAEQPQPVSSALRLWVEIVLALVLGFITFGLCFSIGSAYTATTFSGLSLIVAAAGIGFVMLSLLPPGKRLLAAVGKFLPTKALKWLLIPLLAAVMGLSLGAQHKSFDVWAWVALAIVCIVMALSAAALTREMWVNRVASLRRIQSWLGIGGLVGFLALLALSLTLRQPSLSRLILIPQLLVLAAMSGLGSFLLVGAEEKTPGVDRAMGVLFPAMGLLVLLGLL